MTFKNYSEFLKESNQSHLIGEAQGDTGWVVTAKHKKSKKREIISIPLIRKEAVRFLQNMEVQLSKMADQLQVYSDLDVVPISESLTLENVSTEFDEYLLTEEKKK